MPPDVAVRTTVYVPAGVPFMFVLDELPPPQPTSPNALSKRNAMEIRRRLCIAIIRIKLPKHKRVAGAEPLHGKRVRYFVMPGAVAREAVLIVTLNGTEAEPLTLSGLGVTEQIAPAGSPAQEKVTDPE